MWTTSGPAGEFRQPGVCLGLIGRVLTVIENGFEIRPGVVFPADVRRSFRQSEKQFAAGMVRELVEGRLLKRVGFFSAIGDSNGGGPCYCLLGFSCVLLILWASGLYDLSPYLESPSRNQ